MKVNIKLAQEKQNAEKLNLSHLSYKIYDYIYWEYIPLEYLLGISLKDEKNNICKALKITSTDFDRSIKELVNKCYGRYYKEKFILRGEDEAKTVYQKKINMKSKYT